MCRLNKDILSKFGTSMIYIQQPSNSMLCLYDLSIGGTYWALVSVIFLDKVTPAGSGQRKVPCMSRLSVEVLPRWNVVRETEELADIPTAAPIRATADTAT